MALTTYTHVLLGVVADNGDVTFLYPQNTAKDVSFDNNNGCIPVNIKDLQSFLDAINSMAFETGDNIVFFDSNDEFDAETPVSEINDDIISSSSTWSSKKITSNLREFIPVTETTIANLTEAFDHPVEFIVNGNLSAFSTLCPNNYVHYWIVKYTPIFFDTEGSVRKALQEWRGVRTADYENEAGAFYKYFRFFTQSAAHSLLRYWSTFKKEVEVDFRGDIPVTQPISTN